MKPNLTEVKITQKADDKTDEKAFRAGAKANFKGAGSTGTKINAGYLDEEYLRTLLGRRGAQVYDEMSRSDAQVAMLLKAITNPIKSGQWEFQSAVDVDGGDVHAELIKYIADRMDFEVHKNEVLSFVKHGFSLFEQIHEVVMDDPKFGTFNGLSALAFRAQKTIDRWNVDKVTGKLISVSQFVQGDTATTGTQPKMEAENIALFTLDREGDNYEGVSALRPMFGAWFRKNTYLKLAAIGVEKNAVGTPLGTIPKDKTNATVEVERFEGILENLATHESSYMTVPEGWEIEMLKSDFDPQKIKDLIIFENTEMINAVVANFLALGTNGSGGAFALSSDLSDFFYNTIKQYAKIIEGVWNRVIIPKLIKLNFGPQEAYPRLCITGIEDTAGKELADIVKTLIDSKVIRPDDKLEAFLRKAFDLPEADVDSVRETPAPQPFQAPKLSDRRLLKLADKYDKQWNSNKEAVKEVMQNGLSDIYEAYKKQIKSKWANASSSTRASIATKLEAKGVTAYRDSLREALAEVANESLIGAQKETKWIKKKIKLAESFQLDAPRGGYFNALPNKLRKMVMDQASLIAQTQANDIEKIVVMQFHSSVNSTDNLDQILKDIDDSVEPTIEGSTGKGMSVDAAAGTAVSQVDSNARLEWFFEPEVLETIESFTFLNENPESAVCQDLAGTTWAVGDPDLDRYSPPLHHNCKSRLYANEKGAKNNPAIQRGGTPITQKGLDSITLCECNYHIIFDGKENKKAKSKK